MGVFDAFTRRHRFFVNSVQNPACYVVSVVGITVHSHTCGFKNVLIVFPLGRKPVAVRHMFPDEPVRFISILRCWADNFKAKA